MLLAQENGTKYFQDKADKDKKRYLDEVRQFYDEVNRIHKTKEQTDISGIDDPELEGASQLSQKKRGPKLALNLENPNKKQKLTESQSDLDGGSKFRKADGLESTEKEKMTGFKQFTITYKEQMKRKKGPKPKMTP